MDEADALTRRGKLVLADSAQAVGSAVPSSAGFNVDNGFASCLIVAMAGLGLQSRVRRGQWGGRCFGLAAACVDLWGDKGATATNEEVRLSVEYKCRNGVSSFHAFVDTGNAGCSA
jgi:hypothetical protein